jgi:hypothetical protein
VNETFNSPSIAKRSNHWIRYGSSTTLPDLPVGKVAGNMGTKKRKASGEKLVPEAGLEPARAVKPEGF